MISSLRVHLLLGRPCGVDTGGAKDCQRIIANRGQEVGAETEAIGNHDMHPPRLVSPWRRRLHSAKGGARASDS